MPRIPKSPEEIFDKFSEDVQSVFGAELLSILLFGSGAKGEYVAGKSDINFLIVLSKDGANRLEKAIPVVEKWGKVGVATPLILTREYIDSALDTFPIEFLDIKEFHQLVFGENPVEQITIDKGDLRRQIERELRGKLVYLRTGLLSSGNDKTRLLQMLSASVSAFVPIFEGLLHLEGEPLTKNRSDVFRRTAAEFKLNESVFGQLIHVKSGAWHGSIVQLRELTSSYIQEVGVLVERVDQMGK